MQQQDTAVYYSARIKIVSLQLHTPSPSPSLTATCSLQHSTLLEKEVPMSNGSLLENTTLAFTTLLTPNSTVDVQFYDGECFVGRVRIEMREFQNVKMRKFALTDCLDSRAYMEAFLLLVQTRNQQPEISPINRKACLLSNSSLTHTEMEYSQISEQTDKELSILKAGKSSQQVETQTWDIESLLTINSILQERNAVLERENKELKETLSKKEQTIALQFQRATHSKYNTALAEMREELERVRESLRIAECKLQEKMSMIMLKEQELERKEASLDELRQSNSKLLKELQKERERRAVDESVRDLSIDQMVNELTKYSETAKRYRGTSRVVKVPPSKEELRIYSNRKQGAQETIDSLSESKLL